MKVKFDLHRADRDCFFASCNAPSLIVIINHWAVVTVVASAARLQSYILVNDVHTHPHASVRRVSRYRETLSGNEYNVTVKATAGSPLREVSKTATPLDGAPHL